MTPPTGPKSARGSFETSLRVAGVSLCLLVGSSGCNSSPKRSPAPQPSARSVSSASRSPAATASAARVRPTEYCRAIKVTGEVLQDGGAALKRGDEVDGKHWFSLQEGASLVIRHAQTSREYSLSGPGRVRPCHGGEEEVLLARGEFRATSGGGARPGAFVTLATPWGTLRYGNADAAIRATSQAAEVSVNTGTVWVDAAPGVKLVGDPKLTGPKARGGLRPTPAYKRDALFNACEADAKAAEDKAESLLRGGSQPGLGAQAAEHMRLRAAARRSCQMAQAALGLAVEPAELAELEKRLENANQRWQRVPVHFSQKRQQK